MQLRLAHSDEDFARCHEVLAELRPHLERETPGERLARQATRHGYEVAFAEEDGRVRAVAGFRVSENLAWGRYLYVDDLVTRSADRSRGYGGALLDWLVEQARSRRCDELHLDSGVQRFDAHRFYLTRRMQISSHHFVLKLGG